MNSLLLVSIAIGGFILLIGLIVVLINVCKKHEPPRDDCDISGCSHCISVSKCNLPSARKHREKLEVEES